MNVCCNMWGILTHNITHIILQTNLLDQAAETGDKTNHCSWQNLISQNTSEKPMNWLPWWWIQHVTLSKSSKPNVFQCYTQGAVLLPLTQFLGSMCLQAPDVTTHWRVWRVKDVLSRQQSVLTVCHWVVLTHGQEMPTSDARINQWCPFINLPLRDERN